MLAGPGWPGPDHDARIGVTVERETKEEISAETE
jgi:hypothetical protein